MDARTTLIGERVELARIARGLSQRDLAAAVGLSAMAISKIESGQITPSVDTMRSIYEATQLSASFFERGSLHLPPPLYRKRSSMGAKPMKRIEALAALQLEGVLCAWAAVGVKLPVRVKDLKGSSPEAAADATRQLLGLPADEPVTHLLSALEQAGCVVHQLPVSDERFDGFSTIHGDRPVIFLGRGREGAGDRQRMTAAHELAHTVMHRHLGVEHDRAEKEADEFASALLLPRAAILRDLRKCALTPIGLAPLKAKWRVSIAALAMRASQLGLMTPTQKTSFFKERSARGWTKVEPVPIPLEQTQVFRKAVSTLRKKQDVDLLAACGGVSQRDVFEMLGPAAAAG